MTTRRDLLLQAAMFSALPGLGFAQTRGLTLPLEPTPACGESRDATPRQTEGPFYTPRPPQTANLRESGMAGIPLRIGGLVLDRRCRPVGDVMVDVWQADAAGQYDNAGYRLRGHQFSDGDGRWRFETILPGIYPGRTRHIHVKLRPPRGDVLTTQLYFPDEPGNARDRIFDRRLLVQMGGDETAKIARYDFVLAVG